VHDHLPSLLDGAVVSVGGGLGTERGEEPRGVAESDEPLWWPPSWSNSSFTPQPNTKLESEWK